MLLTNMLTAMLINFISLLTIFMKFIIKRDLLHNCKNCSSIIKNKKLNINAPINIKMNEADGMPKPNIKKIEISGKYKQISFFIKQ